MQKVDFTTWPDADVFNATLGDELTVTCQDRRGRRKRVTVRCVAVVDGAPPCKVCAFRDCVCPKVCAVCRYEACFITADRSGTRVESPKAPRPLRGKNRPAPEYPLLGRDYEKRCAALSRSEI